MPSAARRSRIVQEEESSEEERPQNTQRGRRAPPSDDEEDEEAEDEEADEEMEGDVEPDSQDQLVKKLVRYALACEYQRMPIRRTGISEKVIGKQRGAFKRTFDSAQRQLRSKFGMQMVELPVKEKVTMKDRRAAQKSKSNSKSSATYILTSTLPVQYRGPKIIPPSLVGDEAEEAAYIGICSFIVSVIGLSPQGAISEAKLKAYLERVSASENMPMDKTDAVIARMMRQNYIFKTVERTENDETIEWRVGPRGKIEIGSRGIQGLVREVYGQDAPEDLGKRLQRSLGIEVAEGEDDEEEEDEPTPGPSRARERRRHAAAGNE